jgi:hypothetical protein
MLLLIDERPERPERPEPPARRRREPPSINWRRVACAATTVGLGIGSGSAGGLVGYGMLLGAIVAAGIGFGSGPGINWKAMHEHRQ